MNPLLMSAMTTDPIIPKRRVPYWGWWLAILLIVAVSIAIRFGVPAYRQHRLLTNLRQSGILVETARIGPSSLPETLLRYLADPVSPVVRIRGGQTKLADHDLLTFAGFADLNVLLLNDTQVTDAGLAHLSGLTKLQIVSLGNTQITDVGVAHLKGLTKLRTLNLRGDKGISDVGLTHLAGLPKLRHLDVTGTNVTRSAITKLAGAKRGIEIEGP